MYMSLTLGLGIRSWLPTYSHVGVVNSSIQRQNRSNDHVPCFVHNSHV